MEGTLRERVTALWEADKTRSVGDMAAELKATKGAVHYHLKNLRPKRPPQKKYDRHPPRLSDRASRPMSIIQQQQLTPETLTQVKLLTVKGTSAKNIGKELGISEYLVYIARKRLGVEKGRAQNTGTPHGDSQSGLALKALEMKKAGLRSEEIAARLGKSTKAVYQLMYYYGTKKGLVPNGNNTDTTAVSNGNGQHAGPSKAELLGFAWAQVERGIADISARIALPADVVRRRVSELLGYTAVR